MPLCATYELLEHGISRRGYKSSNPSEQFNSAVLPERDDPIVDLVTNILNKMGDLILKRQKVSPYMVVLHSSFYFFIFATVIWFSRVDAMPH